MLPTPGVYPHPLYGEVDLSPGVMDTILANFQREVYQKHIPIDGEHDLKTSGAAAYITGLHRNADGSVDADVDWTDLGRTLVASDRFRYISPAIKPEWTNPATGETHKHILAGAGLTTRPYFKEASLRPLITASEPVTDRKEHIDMADPKPTPTPNPEPAPTPDPGTPPQPDLSFAEKLVAAENRATELERKFTESETARTELAETVEKMRSEQQQREFREEVEGRSRDNKARYLGDVDKHIGILTALPEDRRADYMELQRTQAKAARAFAERRELGSDALNGTSDAEEQLQAFAEEIRKADPKLSQQQAMTEAYRQHPDLYRQARNA
jgi:hypothetical protein